MKIFNYFKKILFLCIVMFACLLIGCVETPSPNPDEDLEKEPENPPVEEVCPLCEEIGYGKVETHEKLVAHNPTKFDEATYNELEVLNVGDGVIQKTIQFKLNSGKIAQVIAVEVDLTKADIVAGSTGNKTGFSSLSRVIDQVKSYEEDNPNVRVLVATNADFFGNGKSVNAFVKDSVIVKEGHNDNGGYDYTNVNHDVPASMPMLFGVSGTSAKIDSIIKSYSDLTNAQVKQGVVQSKLFYEVVLTDKEGSKVISTDMDLNLYSGEKGKVNYIYKTGRQLTAQADSKVLKVERHFNDSTRVHGKILEIIDNPATKKYQATKDYFYVVIPNSLNVVGLEVNKYISYNISSEDGTWRYYDTILGCRQALVVEGKIPSTVTKENTNGAQRTNIPRSAIGVMPDGKVVIFSVEALRYNSKNAVTDSDPYGLNLPELADFMRYYGVYSGANFDGGGSTQLLTRQGFNGSGDFRVVVRSSDYGTYDVNASRSVINTILVTTKANE